MPADCAEVELRIEGNGFTLQLLCIPPYPGSININGELDAARSFLYLHGDQSRHPLHGSWMQASQNTTNRIIGLTIRTSNNNPVGVKLSELSIDILSRESSAGVSNASSVLLGTVSTGSLEIDLDGPGDAKPSDEFPLPGSAVRLRYTYGTASSSSRLNQALPR